ncbi:MAG: acylphosphatase [Fibrobacter sp.]|nr:acylphosphatase [Fibrobacter sp.]
METKRFAVTVSGKVQGVGFRFFTREAAKKHKLSGWVRNLEDGSVQMEIQGADNDLCAFLKVVENGPILSFVSAMECKEIPLRSEENKFLIIH